MLSGQKEEKNSDNEKTTAGKFWLFIPIPNFPLVIRRTTHNSSIE